MERSGLFPSHKYAYRKGVGTCDALLDIVCAGKRELDGGRELALVQLYFSAAFDRVSHRGLLFKLRDAGIGGSILVVLCDFLSERTQVEKLGGVRSSVVNVVSGAPQGSVLGSLLIRFYIRDLQPLLENVLVGHADDSTLLANVSSPCERPTIAAPLNRDLINIDKWCARWGMLINYGMMISGSRTAWPTFPDLFVGGIIVKMVRELKILDVVIDSKLSDLDFRESCEVCGSICLSLE